ncbi:hypothetical protein [Janthinobacterium psychrotolerans]|uniref:Uncharacterized protein n=1 Tax=Janthinobacterium psychrotolerans TaxID=1747903 RepID=A0A1A7BVL8_9BURK|nr:hypothetical protein [Janthinobacterium psychrotolerans]OBV37606.1 hypothetical protein ASR47_1003268 [Janthinobacterium psychrotolerans]
MIVAADAAQWEQLYDLPLLERLGPAQQEIVTHVTQVNLAMDVPQRPSSTEVDDGFQEDVRAAIAAMPASVQALLDGVLLGVRHARQLGSSAISDIVVSGEGVILGVVVALDVDAFESRTANAWATWKENTPFAPEGAYTLSAQIALPEDDNRQGALQYLLLHEFGHVLSAGRNLLHDWWLDAQSLRGADDYHYLPLAWRIDAEKKVVPLAQNAFALRGDIVYYHGARMQGSQMAQAYAQLQGANFATLYAATSVHEDFAESFASYVHAVMLGKPQTIRIEHDGALLLRFDGYWESPRSAAKRALLERLLG